MIQKLLREFFLLRHAERRALVVLSVLLVASLAFRVWVHSRPPRQVPGWEAFVEELAALESLRDQVPPRIELNGADSLDLLPLPGIGPSYASRILKYRELLGGYVQVGQLMEVYGMDSGRFIPLLPLVEVDAARIRPLELNSASFRDLLRHPYLDFEAVKALLNYRDHRGHISGPDEIREHALLTDSSLRRVHPYLRFE